MFDADVFISGGGPAGLAAAIAARRKGFRVILADGSTPPVDKACGEGLTPDSITAAASLGIDLPVAESCRFQGIRFIQGGLRTSALFPDGDALGVRRTVLHRSLARQAASAGVELLWATPVTGIANATASLAPKAGLRRSIRARWIVGADGGRSQVRAWAGLNQGLRERVRFGFRRHYGIVPWANFAEVYWGPGFQVYVTPVASVEVSVAVVSRDPGFRLDAALAKLPELHERLAGAPVCSDERGGISATRRLRAVCHGSVVLIGDASGSVDVITGQGVGLAFQQAHALADALADEDLSSYLRAHRRIARRPALMAALLLTMDRRPWLGGRAMRALTNHPALFERLLAVHVGALKPLEEVAVHARLGWHLLRG